MFYLTSKLHDNRVNAFGFVEGVAFEVPPPSQAQELQKSPGGIGLTHIFSIHTSHRIGRIFRDVTVYILLHWHRCLSFLTEQLNDQLWIMTGLWKISYVRNFESNILNAFCATRCLKTRIFTANVWLINYFATQLFCVFLKTNIFLKTQRTKLIRTEFWT